MRDNGRGSDQGRFGGEYRGTNRNNGANPDGVRTRAVPFDEHSTNDAYGGAEPVDLVAVQADDELINALAAGMSVTSPGVGGYDADDRVAAILAAWKAEVDAAPIPELVDIDTAVKAVMTHRPPSRRTRHLAPLAAAAAFIVLAVGGLGVSVSSYYAQPDDVLWGVSKVLYSERAESVEAAARVETHIARAKEALVAGQPAVAEQELAQAEADLAAVRPEEGQAELAEVQDFLVAKVQETPPGQPTDPGTPLVTEPLRPVPKGAASDTSVPPPAPAPPAPASEPAVAPGQAPPVGDPSGPTGSTGADQGDSSIVSETDPPVAPPEVSVELAPPPPSVEPTESPDPTTSPSVTSEEPAPATTTAQSLGETSGETGDAGPDGTTS